MFKLLTLLTLTLSLPHATATLNPALSNTKGAFPSSPLCSPVKTSKAIQAAECSHNTRAAGQTFAVFKQDHEYDGINGFPYGTCEAYDCKPGTEMSVSEDYWTFFWEGAGVQGVDAGEGVGCIKSPDDGTCGCENSDGRFVYGGSECV